jgi:hypothetical protein
MPNPLGDDWKTKAMRDDTRGDLQQPLLLKKI